MLFLKAILLVCSRLRRRFDVFGSPYELEATGCSCPANSGPIGAVFHHSWVALNRRKILLHFDRCTGSPTRSLQLCFLLGYLLLARATSWMRLPVIGDPSGCGSLVTKTISDFSCYISLRLVVLRPCKILASWEIRTPFEWRTLVFPGFQSLELYRSLLTLRALFTDIRWRACFAVAGCTLGFGLHGTSRFTPAVRPGLSATTFVIRAAPEKAITALNST